MTNFQTVITNLIDAGATDLGYSREPLSLWETTLIHSALCLENNDWEAFDNSEFRENFNQALASF
jgi:hypothetical protein